MKSAGFAFLLLGVASLAAAAPADDEIARLEATLDALPRVPSWPLREVFLKTMKASLGSTPADLTLLPVAEVYRGDRAMLFMAAAAGEARPELLLIGFRKARTDWAVVEGATFRDWDAVEEMVFRGPGETRIVRRGGLPLETLPLHLRYVLGEQRQGLRAAAAAGDWKKWAALMDRGLAGVGLCNFEDMVRAHENQPEKIDAVRLVRQEPQGERVVAHFDNVTGGRSSHEAFVLARQGAGWVIDEPYVAPVEQTLRTMRTLVVALAAYSVDHGDAYPAVADHAALAALLTPTYAQRLPAADGWGTPFRYVRADGGKSFRIVSAGADKTFKPETWSLTGSYTDPSEDMVMDDAGVIMRSWQPPR